MNPENYKQLHDWLRELKELDDISVDATATEIAKLIDSEVTAKMTELSRPKAEEYMPTPMHQCTACKREIYQTHDGTWLHSPIYTIDHEPQSAQCPQCGAHLALWMEVFGEEHHCVK